MRTRRWFFPVLMMAFAVPAIAQTAPGVAPGPRWEVEIGGGLSLGRYTNGGRLDFPPAGAPITTSSPVFPSWQVPTWLFGDGAAFLNNVAAEFGVPSRIVPLDASLRPAGPGDAGAASVGVRVRRNVGRAYSIEFGLDMPVKGSRISGGLIDDLETTRSSFEDTLRAVLPEAIFTDLEFSGATSATTGSSRELAFTVALNNRLRPMGGFTPYATAGGGVIVQVGDLPAATVGVRYQFRIDGVVPIDESDTLTLRYSQRTAFVLVAGGGVRRDLSPRLGLVIDARLLTGPNTTTVRAQAAPSSVTATPAGFIESFTYPNLQFSNNPSTGRQSTLSGTLSDVEVFRGGWVTRGRVTAGLTFSF